MPSRDNQPPNHPLVEGVLCAIADWVNKYRFAFGQQTQLGLCGPDQVMSMAKDIGVTPSELRELASKGPDAADLIQKMLVALHVDPKALAHGDPLAMRDLQKLCIVCSNKSQCEHELANGTAAEHFRVFCPNAVTLDALFTPLDRSSRH